MKINDDSQELDVKDFVSSFLGGLALVFIVVLSMAIY